MVHIICPQQSINKCTDYNNHRNRDNLNFNQKAKWQSISKKFFVLQFITRDILKNLLAPLQPGSKVSTKIIIYKKKILWKSINIL